MCSWCWGFAPELDNLMKKYDDVADFEIVLGGLRPGQLAQKMDEKTKRFIKHHWKQVEERSGQPFNTAFFEQEDFVYDTEPASRAVVVMKRLAPEFEFEFFKRIQFAFYAENKDPTDIDTFLSLLKGLPAGADEFVELFNKPEVQKETYANFQLSAKLGISGFPSLLMKKKQKLSMVTTGYQKAEELYPRIDSILSIQRE